eukprot:TRINITY_DN4912_c0_g1_i1.p1 TRINITY_DN4912_c0_g1~~TRINITY_DN4912_c0_g1_i1.p1  ORF type:complete len:306 (-),score=42.05 TRINITY_DN4912_c0_g1_i1:56-973(-)
MGTFRLQVRVLAATLDGLSEPSQWAPRRPRVRVLLGDMREETDTATWCASESSTGGPSGRECPWRFGSSFTFKTSIDDIEARASLDFQVQVQNDVTLGPLTLQLPVQQEFIGTATADVQRHVLPICLPVRGAVKSRFTYESPVQMVSLKDPGKLSETVGAVAVSFALDADPKELLATASIAAAARPLLRRHGETSSASSECWYDCCGSMSVRGARDGAGDAPAMSGEARPDSPTDAWYLSQPSPKLSSDGWISRHGPGGRVFWHHTALGPAPWDAVPGDLKDNRAFFRSVMGKEGDPLLWLASQP